MIGNGNGLINEVLYQRHVQELRQEANAYRLVRQAQAAGERPDPLFARFTLWLGNRFVAWGQTLVAISARRWASQLAVQDVSCIPVVHHEGG